MSILRYSLPNTWSSFGGLASLHDEVNRLFDFATPGFSAGWTPALDLYEQEDQFTVTVELPGLRREDVQISLEDGVLHIAGERKQETEKEGTRTYRSERSFGRFQRSVTLPSAVNGTAVKAAYKDGMLTVTLPKAEEAKPRRIEVAAE